MPKILVIDDEDDVRNVVAAILKQVGYDVIEAEYGLQGYSKAQSEQPDLVMLDLMMPVVDGFQILGKLKSDPSTASIPVIILTAKIDAASERECMRLGAVDYIKKPWGPRELQDRIGMALGYPDLGGPRKTRNDEPRTGGEADNSESSDVSQPRGLPALRSPVDPERAPSDGPDLSRPLEAQAHEFPVGVQTEYPEYPDLRQPPGSPVHESPVGVQTEYPENPAVIRSRRFRIRRFAAEGYGEEDHNAGPDLSQPPAGEEEDPESQDLVEYWKQFRTRRFRVRTDGIDPASLV